mgnify:CR=1 FL=1
MRDLNDLTRPTVPSGAIQERMLAETEERRGVVGPAPALPDDAGAPAALRICHLAAGNQSPDPLIDFCSLGTWSCGSWESVTRPLDRLRGLFMGCR